MQTLVEPTEWAEIFAEAGPRLLFRLPEFIVALLGLILVFRYWVGDRRTALLLLAGCALLIVGPLFHEFGTIVIWRRPEFFGLNRVRFPIPRWLWIQLISSFLMAAAMTLLGLAVLVKNRPKLNVSWDTD